MAEQEGRLWAGAGDRAGAPFLGNVLRVLRGTVLAQALAALALPLLARLFPPEAFALSQAFVALVTAAMVASCLRYDQALTVCAAEEIGAVSAVSVGLGLLVSAGLAGAVASFPWLLAAVGLQALQPLAGWLALGVVLAALANASTLLLIRRQSFAPLADAKVAQALVFVAAAAAVGLAAPAREGVVWADLAGRAALLAGLALALRRAGEAATPRPRPAEVWRVLVRYRRFPLLSLPGALLNTAGGMFGAVWMLALFGPAPAGAYALIERLAAGPAALVGGAVQQVYQGRLSAALREGHAGLGADFRRLLVSQARLAAGPAVLMAALGPLVVPVVLGPGGGEAGLYARILSLYVFAAFVAAPFGMVLTLLERQGLQTAWEVGRFALVAGAWLGGWRLGWGAAGTLTAVSAAGAVAYGLYLTIAWRALRRRERLGSPRPAG